LIASSITPRTTFASLIVKPGSISRLEERIDALTRTHNHDTNELHRRVFETNEARIQALFKAVHEADKFVKADHVRLKALEERWGYIWKVLGGVITGIAVAAYKAYL